MTLGACLRNTVLGAVIPMILATGLAYAEPLPGGSSPDAWQIPGWSGALMTVKDAGLSITFTMEKDGMVICGSQQDSNDMVIPTVKRCNQRITPVGYHIPIGFLFQGAPRLVRWGKIFLVSLPLAAAQFNLGIGASAAAATNNLVTFSPKEMIEAQHELKTSFETLKFFATDTASKSNGVIPTAQMPFHYVDVAAALSGRVAAFVKHCNRLLRHEDVSHPDYVFCKKQGANTSKADTVMKVCQIPEVPYQAGEPGNADIWRLGQPLPPGCAEMLAKYDGSKPLFEAGGADSTTRGEHLLQWVRETQVEEWLAENAVTAAGSEAATKSLGDFKRLHPDLAGGEGELKYRWMLSVDPCQADQAPEGKSCQDRYVPAPAATK